MYIMGKKTHDIIRSSKSKSDIYNFYKLSFWFFYISWKISSSFNQLRTVKIDIVKNIKFRKIVYRKYLKKVWDHSKFIPIFLANSGNCLSSLMTVVLDILCCFYPCCSINCLRISLLYWCSLVILVKLATIPSWRILSPL